MDGLLVHWGNETEKVRNHRANVLGPPRTATRFICIPSAKPAFGGLLTGSHRFACSNRHSTSFREPESSSCERLSLLNVPECGEREAKPVGGAYAHQQTVHYFIIVLD